MGGRKKTKTDVKTHVKKKKIYTRRQNNLIWVIVLCNSGGHSKKDKGLLLSFLQSVGLENFALLLKGKRHA